MNMLEILINCVQIGHTEDVAHIKWEDYSWKTSEELTKEGGDIGL